MTIRAISIFLAASAVSMAAPAHGEEWQDLAALVSVGVLSPEMQLAANDEPGFAAAAVEAQPVEMQAPAAIEELALIAQPPADQEFVLTAIAIEAQAAETQSPATIEELASVMQLPTEEEIAFAALTDEELGEERGGATVMVANQSLVAITAGNVLTGGYSAGSVSLSDFALSNFNGIGNLMINTGAQVNLQTGMNLTINVGD
jgi:hypothetical protein